MERFFRTVRDHPVLIAYAGHSRNGITPILAESFAVDNKGRGIPLNANTLQHIEAMVDGANPRHPVIVVDDAQRVENNSLWDLCPLLFQTAKPTATTL
jgi:general secretion pathway protein A